MCTRRRTDVRALRVRALVQSRTDIALGTANAGRRHWNAHLPLPGQEGSGDRYERHRARRVNDSAMDAQKLMHEAVFDIGIIDRSTTLARKPFPLRSKFQYLYDCDLT